MKRFSKIFILFGVILFILCIGGCFRSRSYTLEEGEYVSVYSIPMCEIEKDNSIDEIKVENNSNSIVGNHFF